MMPPRVWGLPQARAESWLLPRRRLLACQVGTDLLLLWCPMQETAALAPTVFADPEGVTPTAPAQDEVSNVLSMTVKVMKCRHHASLIRGRTQRCLRLYGSATFCADAGCWQQGQR